MIPKRKLQKTRPLLEDMEQKLHKKTVKKFKRKSKNFQNKCLSHLKVKIMMLMKMVKM